MGSILSFQFLPNVQSSPNWHCSIKGLQIPANTLFSHLALHLCSSFSPALLSCCHVTHQRCEQQSERRKFCLRLMQSLIMTERRCSAVWSCCSLLHESTLTAVIKAPVLVSAILALYLIINTKFCSHARN